MLAGSMFVRSLIRLCIRTATKIFKMYATTAQDIQTDLVGINHNRSKHSYIYMLQDMLSYQFHIFIEIMILLRTNGWTEESIFA